VLSRHKVGRYYRFYGARHSILQLGHLIDFETEEDGMHLPRMRSLSHFSFPWLFDLSRLMLWQNLMQQLEKHLRDTEEIDTFYFDTLLETARKWHRQNPKRLGIEWYVRMLAYEGRLFDTPYCYICEKPLHEHVSLMAGLKPAHPECIYAPSIPKKSLMRFFKTAKSTWLSDEEVSLIYQRMAAAF
jgi:recombinational DNA repair protein (RecF pathway)